MGAYGHPLSLTKHAFFVLFMHRGHADVWGHVDTSFVWQSIISLCCACTGGIQTSSKYMGASKHLSFSSQTQSHFPRLVPSICTKKPSLIHSDSTWWWQPSWILPCWIQTLPSWIQTPCYLLSDSLKNTFPPLWLWLKLIQSDTNSFILTQLDDGSHLEFCHVGFRHLVFFSQIHSKTLSLHSDSDSNLIWLKLIHSHSTWWWWPSWILLSWILPSWIPPSWIQLLPCWIQTPFLLSDSLKNTLSPIWLWLKLIQSN